MKKIRLIILGIIIILIFATCSLIKYKPDRVGDSDTMPLVLMFSGSIEDAASGELFAQAFGSEKVKIADNVQKDQYIVMPETEAILFMDTEGVLYLKEDGKEKETISDKVLPSSFSYSKDESTISFLRKTDDSQASLSELYIKKIGSDKEKITSDMHPSSDLSTYRLSIDASEIYYINNDRGLYKKTTFEEKEKIDSDISAFTLNPDSPSYAYLNYHNYYYVKWPNDNVAQLVATDNVGNLRLSKNGCLVAFTGAYNYSKGYGELYVIIRGGNAIKVASDVKSFNLSEDGQGLYYINDEDTVYYKELPYVDEETYKNQLKFIDEVNNTEKIKISIDVASFQVSPSGSNCLIIDNDGNLYLSVDQNEKVKIATDITEGKVFSDSLLFVNKNRQLSFNNINDGKNSDYDSQLLAENIINYSTSDYGKYILYSDAGSNQVFMCNDGQATEVIISDYDSYDKIIYNDVPLYDKKLKLSDIVGNYKNEALSVAYKITTESAFLLYETGTEKEDTVFKANGNDKYSLRMIAEDPASVLTQNSYIFTKKQDGAAILTINGIDYPLVALNDEELASEIERQRQKEALRIAEKEKRAKLDVKRKELAEIGKTYMKSGIYVEKGEKLYFSPDFNNTSNLTNTASGMKDVYGYQVSGDGATLWLKLYSVSASGGYAGYVWVGEPHNDI